MNGVEEIVDLDAEIARVASNPTRKQALDLFAEGRLADGLKCLKPYPQGWADSMSIEESRGFWEDTHLNNAIVSIFYDTNDLSLFGKANFQIELWGASPLEIALRKGTPEAFERALDEACSPKRRFETAGKDIGRGWSSLTFRELVNGTNFFGVGKGFDSLFLLALLLGKTDAANLIIRKGWHSLTNEGSLNLLDKIKAQARENTDETVAWMQIDAARLTEAASRLNGVWKLEEMMNDDFDSTRRKDTLLKKTEGLLAQNAPVNYFSLGVATEKNALELLNKLFEHGGDPNCRYHTGIPMLASLDSKKLSSEALQIWLDYGANPSLGENPSEPFGNRRCPSAIYEWVSEGRLDLIRQATKNAACSVKLFNEVDGDFYSLPLVLALARSHVELAKWMIEEQGCSLEHFGENSNTTCRSYASDKTLAKLTALLHETALRNKHKDALSKPRPPRGVL